MINAGANVDAVDEYRRTTLMYAIDSRKIGARTLIEKSADVNAVVKEECHTEGKGRTALECTLLSPASNKDIVRLLVKHSNGSTIINAADLIKNGDISENFTRILQKEREEREEYFWPRCVKEIMILMIYYQKDHHHKENKILWVLRF